MTLILILACAVLLGGCAGAPLPSAGVRPVKTVTAASLSGIQKDFAGMATSDDEVNLAFKLPGQVMSITVSEGESVRRGELLAELDPRDMELRVSADRSAYEEASSQLQRMKRLLEHDAVSRQEVEMAQTRYAQTKAAYENSRDLLKDTRLRAPFDGVVERKLADNFERVEAGQPIIRFVKPETTTVKCSLRRCRRAQTGRQSPHPLHGGLRPPFCRGIHCAQRCADDRRPSAGGTLRDNHHQETGGGGAPQLQSVDGNGARVARASAARPFRQCGAARCPFPRRVCVSVTRT